MPNISVNPKSTRDEARFHCIGSRAILRSTSYITSGLTSFRQLQRIPAKPVSSLEEHQFPHSKSRKVPCTPNGLNMRVDSLASSEEVSQLSTCPSRGGRPQNMYVRGSLSLLPHVEWTLRCPGLKEGWISLQWLECTLAFIPREEWVSESPVETIEKALGPRLIWTAGLTSL